MAMADQEQARDEILDLFKTAWDAGLESAGIAVVYLNDGQQPPDAQETGEAGSPTPWARVSLFHATGGATTLAGGLGAHKETSEGFLQCEIYVAPAQGLRQADRLAKIVKNAFRGQRTAGGATFRNVRHQEIGRDGVWFRMDVLVDFEYDEIV
jgi:hypothetical protein